MLTQTPNSLHPCRLWHVGRASHPDFQPNDAAPVAPSALPITGEAWTVYTPKGGPFPYPTPRALEEAEIKAIVADFAQGAKNALEAGFDGVEIHSANGYLLNQFLCDSTNKREDSYGGSIENRCRLTLEVVDAVVKAVGAGKMGIRLAPFNMFLDCTDSDPKALYGHLIPQLSKRKLGYVHLIAARQFEATPADDPNQLGPFRKMFAGTAIIAGGYDRATGAAAIADGTGDAVAYGCAPHAVACAARCFIAVFHCLAHRLTCVFLVVASDRRFYLANPDLPKRYAQNAELNAYDRDSFYNPMMPVQGYTDCACLPRPQCCACILRPTPAADAPACRAADPFLGQEATPGVPAVDPYAVKGKN
jgi:2,4-dienoyl-CoA reductase-like NADH-dependent reductase (Old Yellow Enzyme family)